MTEIIDIFHEGTAFRFDADEVRREIYFGTAAPAATLQTCAATLAANVEIPGYAPGAVVGIEPENFNDCYSDMLDSLRGAYVEELQQREKALRAIALECFAELMGELPLEILQKRLNDAIAAAIKQQE